MTFRAGWPRVGKGKGMFRILSRTMPDLRAEIAQATADYYAQANQLTLTATDLYDWLGTLPTARRERVLHSGFATSRAEPDFLRYCLEMRGYSMRSFLAEALPVAAYALWAAHGEPSGNFRLPDPA